MKELKLSLWELALLPLALPVKGLLFVADQVRAMAAGELNAIDEQTLRGRLADLQVRFELGEIGEVEYRQTWGFLTDRLRDSGESGNSAPFTDDGGEG